MTTWYCNTFSNDYYSGYSANGVTGWLAVCGQRLAVRESYYCTTILMAYYSVVVLIQLRNDYMSMADNESNENGYWKYCQYYTVLSSRNQWWNKVIILTLLKWLIFQCETIIINIWRLAGWRSAAWRLKTYPWRGYNENGVRETAALAVSAKAVHRENVGQLASIEAA